MARQILTKKGNGLIGAEELTRKLDELAAGLSGAEKTQLSREVLAAIGDTGQREIADAAKANALSKGVPREVSDSIFVDASVKGLGGAYRKLSVLIGVNKRRSMREWRASESSQMNARAKVSPGGKVAMSLATMFEYGTSKMRPKPYLRPAIESGRRTVPQNLAAPLWNIIRKWALR